MAKNGNRVETWQPVVLTAAHANNPLQVFEYAKAKAGINESAISNQVQARAALSAGERSTLGGVWA